MDAEGGKEVAGIEEDVETVRWRVHQVVEVSGGESSDEEASQKEK